jgi:hypothetical protein
MPEPILPRKSKRKKPSADTAREKSLRACAKHLKDLKRAHRRPPPDVKVPMSSTVRFIAPVPEGSWCTSPAQLCAELAE